MKTIKRIISLLLTLMMLITSVYVTAFAQETEAEIKNDIYKEFYVSLAGSDEDDGTKEKPFKTIKRAQEEVRKFNKTMTGDIYVYIEPGYHKIEETLQFSSMDGGTDKYNVIYKGTTPFSESVIGGGNLITGWEKTDNELYKAYYDSPNDFRNLYINDVPAIRAMTKYIYKPSKYFKNDNSEYEYDGMKFSRKNFPLKFYDASRAEAVWTVEWINYRLPIKSVLYDEKEVIMEMEQSWFNSMTTNKNTSAVKKSAAVYFENDLKFLDEPGEFYYDIKNKTVYYYPREGEKLENVYACDTEYLINAEGTIEDNIKNLHFEGLSFKHGAWYEANKGYHHGQAHTVSRPGVKTRPPLAQLEFKHVTGLEIKDCKLIGLGSAGIGITNGVTNSKIVGNLFKEISAHAILAGLNNHVEKMPEGHARVSDILIKNNVIRRASREYRDCPAIHLFYVKNFDITHNDIEEVGYCGISLGWGWGKDVTESGGHTISYNRIVDVMGPTNDGGSIYTLSPSRNTKIFRNYLKGTHDWRGGIYYDEGTAYVESFENVCDVAGNWVWARANASLSENKLYNNWHWSKIEGIDPNGVSAYDNKLEPDGENGIWSPEAQAVIDGAGVEDAYKQLVKEAELPDYAKGYMRDLPKGVYTPKNGWITPATYVDFLDLDGSTPCVNSAGNVGMTLEGEWCEYDVDISQSGMYKFSIKVGNGNKAQSPKVKLYIDGKVADDGIPVPMWKENKWTTGVVEGQEYYLEAGVHKVRIEHKDGNFMFGPFKFSMGDVSTETDPLYDEGKLPSEMKAIKNNIFLDLVNHWAKESVNSLYEKGIVKGVSKTEFAPQREITLKEAVILAMRASGLGEEKWKEKITELGMSHYITAADRAVSREEYCNLIMKFYTDIKGPYTYTEDYNLYGDFSSISSDNLLSVWGAKEYGLMNGDEKGNFNPKKSLTRAEAATVILRYYKIIK